MTSPNTPPVPQLTAHGTERRSLLVWRVPPGWDAVSTAILGGGSVHEPAWIVNASVPNDYSRMDPVAHLGEIAGEQGLSGEGIGLMTAVDVGDHRTIDVDGAVATSTTGVTRPVSAGTGARADTGSSGTAPPRNAPRVDTINTVCFVPACFEAGAQLNLLTTLAEAKAQALFDAGVAGTGTASDAAVVLTAAATDGGRELFGGSASVWGARLGRAVYRSIHGALVSGGSM